MPLDPADPARERLGVLVYRGGLEFLSDNELFGGFSGLLVAPDGGHLLALSDRGTWLAASLDHGQGRLTGLGEVTLGRLCGADRGELDERSRDAEALAEDGAGGLLVAFERDHRLWRYPSAEPPFSAAPEPVIAPADLAALDKNDGVEALTRLCDGRLLAIAEEAEAEHDGAWLREGDNWRRLPYARTEAFRPTDATILPDCSVLVLERRKTDDDQIEVRLVRLDETAFGKGAVPAPPQELVRLGPPLTAGRFEAVASRRGPGGETLIYLLSDNGFRAKRGTLMMLFALGP